MLFRSKIIEEGGVDFDLLERIMLQGFKALKFLEEKNVVHGDIKPENITLKDRKITLIDFDLAFIGTLPGSKLQGTPELFSPEAILYLEKTKAIDIWAFACTIFACYTGEYPFGMLGREMQRLPLLASYHEKGLGKHYPEELIKKRRGRLYQPAREPLGMGNLKEILIEKAVSRRDSLGKVNSFYGLLEKMFIFEPEKRLTATGAIQEMHKEKV